MNTQKYIDRIEYLVGWLGKRIAILRYAALFVLFVWLFTSQVQVVPGAFAGFTLILGLALLAVDLAYEWRPVLAFLRGRRTRSGLRFSATLFLIAAILGLLYYLFVRHITLRADLTSNQRFSLSEQTELTLKELKEPVKFWIFKMEAANNANRSISALLNYVSSMEELLRDYARKSSFISHEIVDVYEEPELVKEFEIREAFTVVVAAGKKTQKLRPQDYIITEQTAQGLAEVPQFEESFTTAINILTRKETWKILFTSGHLEQNPLDENGYYAICDKLSKNGFYVESTNLLLSGGVPAEYDLLIVAGPRDDLPPQEVGYIEDYLMQGKPAIFMAARESGPNYRALVSRWGADIGTGIIFDPTRLIPDFFNRFLGIIPDIEPHRITRGLSEETFRQPMLYGLTVPLARSAAAGGRTDEKSGVTFTNYNMYSLLKSTAAAWEETDLRALGRNDGNKKRGALDAALIVTVPAEKKEIKDGAEVITQAGPAKELNLAVFGNVDFLSSGYLQNSPGNADIFIGTINWAIGQEGRIAISPRVAKSYPIRLTQGEANFIKYFVIFVIPLAVIIAGIVVYFRRKRYAAA
ncbi:MAG: GldG family protein [Spirochaetota bacterium]|jgi:hypothetical protein|nr:GldG family protein [Spirochaetota bacterium]